MNDIYAAGEPGRQKAGLAIAAGVLAGLWCSAAWAAAPDLNDQPHRTWKVAIGRTPVPRSGCFHAAFPSTVWSEVQCTVAPNRPYLPRSGSGKGFKVGDGNDYAGVVSGILATATGFFPKVKKVTSEKNFGQANTYSIQLNSQFFSSAACANAANPNSCLGWEQFVYANSGSGQAFMQYWLINYNAKCPTGGWMAAGGDCYRNSAAVNVPDQTIDQLAYLQESGNAVLNGLDTLTFTTATDAYSTTGEDSVVYLASSWNAAEYNIVGNGGGSEADFNSGSKITVQIDLVDGSTKAPVCQSHDGTTGETNNLNLGSCKAKRGATPFVKFTESN